MFIHLCLHVSVLHCFLGPNTFLLSVHTAVCLSIYWLLDTWVVSTLGLFGLMLLCTLVNKSLQGYLFSVLSSSFLEVELQSCMTILFNSLGVGVLGIEPTTEPHPPLLYYYYCYFSCRWTQYLYFIYLFLCSSEDRIQCLTCAREVLTTELQPQPQESNY